MLGTGGGRGAGGAAAIKHERRKRQREQGFSEHHPSRNIAGRLVRERR